jgi:hypothetical protein
VSQNPLGFFCLGNLLKPKVGFLYLTDVRFQLLAPALLIDPYFIFV